MESIFFSGQAESTINFMEIISRCCFKLLLILILSGDAPSLSYTLISTLVKSGGSIRGVNNAIKIVWFCSLLLKWWSFEQSKIKSLPRQYFDQIQVSQFDSNSIISSPLCISGHVNSLQKKPPLFFVCLGNLTHNKYIYFSIL